jgi:hypothetical protein
MENRPSALLPFRSPIDATTSSVLKAIGKSTRVQSLKVGFAWVTVRAAG